MESSLSSSGTSPHSFLWIMYFLPFHDGYRILVWFSGVCVFFLFVCLFLMASPQLLCCSGKSPTIPFGVATLGTDSALGWEGWAPSPGPAHLSICAWPVQVMDGGPGQAGAVWAAAFHWASWEAHVFFDYWRGKCKETARYRWFLKPSEGYHQPTSNFGPAPWVLHITSYDKKLFLQPLGHLDLLSWGSSAR